RSRSSDRVTTHASPSGLLAIERPNLRIFTYPRPTIAAINGHAFAGGLITALACDYRLATPHARLCLNEVPIGIPMPSTYVEIIRYSIGVSSASELVLFGREYLA